jgi:hypothetical protein
MEQEPFDSEEGSVVFGGRLGFLRSSRMASRFSYILLEGAGGGSNV